jgi:hypothetical protein
VSTITQLPSPAESDTGVHLDGDSLLIRNLTITHAEAAALAREHVAAHGDAALLGLILQAVPVGVLALSLGSASLNSAAVQRTLDLCASQVDAAASAAISKLDRTTAALHQGEQELVNSAQRVLERLPERVEVALAGAAGSVRAQVAAAASEVQAAGLSDMRASMAQHSQAVRAALGPALADPVKALREDVLAQLASVGRDLGGQLTEVQLLLTATRAAAATKTTRATGLVFEDAAMKLAEEVVTGAGDFFQAVGSRPAPGSTSRAGDGVATLNTVVTGRGRVVKMVLEAKTRPSGPLTEAKWLAELQASTALRGASGAIGIVPDATQVPGGRLFARVGERLFVCVCDDQILMLTYLCLRELTALAADSHGDVGAADISKAESRIGQALASLSDLDMVTRHSAAAVKSLEKVQTVTSDVRTRVEETLRASLSALHSA